MIELKSVKNKRSLTGARHHNVVSNVCWNWIANIVSAVVGFLLAPVMVHRLGDAGYGIWAFGMQLTTYLSIMDLGVRAAVGRFLTYHHTRDEKEQINETVSVALTILGGLGFLCIVLSFVAARLLPHMVNVPAAILNQSKWTVLLISWTVAVSFPGAIFSGAISSLSRYDLLNTRFIIGTIVRAAFTWFVLVKGMGMVAAALVLLLTTIAGVACDVLIATRLYEGFAFRIDWQTYGSICKKLFAFSFYAFLLGISSRLVLWSDSVVIAMVLGPVLVTFYAIAGNLIDVARNALASVTSVFVPLATSYDAKGDLSALRRLLIRGSRIGLLVILPGVLAFFILGRDFISLWMGSRYAPIAATVLILLSIPLLFAALQATSNQILYGMNRHRLYSYVALFEALVNLGLSIVLAYRIGVVGVAWGTMIPAAIIEGMVVPVYTARLLNESIARLYWHSWIQPLTSSLPYCAWLLFLHRTGWSTSWIGFTTTILSGLLVYSLTGWFLTLSGEEREMVLSRLKQVTPIAVSAETWVKNLIEPTL